MEYLPEQRRILDLLRQHGTEADAAMLVADTRGAFAAFHDAFATVPPALRLVQPFPGRWSPQEIIDHVVECHRIAPRQLQRLLDGLPGDEAIRAYVQSPAPHAKHWRALLKEFTAIHNEILAAAEALARTPMPSVTVPMEIVVRVKEGERQREREWKEEVDWKAYLQALRAHAGQHVRQLERTLTEIGE